MSELVIVAEDDADLRDLLVMSVEGAGFEAQCVRDGFQAVRLLERTTPRALITDVRMPSLTGLDLCRWVRGEERLADTRVVIVSAAVSPDDVWAGFAAGADDYLIKPFSPRMLRARLTDLLRAPATAGDGVRDAYLRDARRNAYAL